MTLHVLRAETRLQRALRLLAASKAAVARHDVELERLRAGNFCIRRALCDGQALRAAVAQCRRDLIWAKDRIRFGWDDPEIEAVSRSRLRDANAPDAASSFLHATFCAARTAVAKT